MEVRQRQLAVVRTGLALALALLITGCSYRVVEDDRLNSDAVRSLIRKTVETRRLPLKQKLPVELVDQRVLRAELIAGFEKSPEREKIGTYELFLKKLGLIPQDMALETLIIDMLSGQVAGYYDPEKKVLRLVAENAGLGESFGWLENILQRDLAGEFLVAHEVAHALADQNFDLTTFIELRGNSDAAVARKAFVEGEAMVVGLHVLLRQPMRKVAYQPAAEKPSQDEQWANLPVVLKRQILFEYLDGMQFAGAVFRQGGTDALNAAYRNPPASSEQILHPEKYLKGNDAPVPVTFEADPPAFAGLKRIDDDTMGEIGVLSLLEEPLGLQGARVTAAGWGGDRFRLYRNPLAPEAIGFVWRTVWDTAADQVEFTANLGQALSKRFAVEAETAGDVRRWKTAEGKFEIESTGPQSAEFRLIP